METKRNPHRRRSIRLRNFDYSRPGAYFVTVCTRARACLFGDVVDAEMRLNQAGRIVEQCWTAIPSHFPDAVLDAFVVMPNHLHGVVVIAGEIVGAKNFSPLPGTSKTIGSIVRGFKIGVTKWFKENRGTDEVWQRNFYEHIIRDDESLNRIREYIRNNPMRWSFDRENPGATELEPEDAWLK